MRAPIVAFAGLTTIGLAAWLVTASWADQATTWSADFACLASELVPAIPSTHQVTVALLPVLDAAGRLGPGVGLTLTDGLHRALDASARPPGAALHVIAGPELSRTLADHEMPAPRSLAAAAVASTLANAEYAVFGSVTIETGRTVLTVSLVDSGTGRVLRTSSAPIVSERTGEPATAQPMPSIGIERSFWTSRRVAIAAELAATATATLIALHMEQEVRTARAALLAVPVGATDEFKQQRDAAARTEHTRNFWWGVAGGLGGLTIITVAVQPSPSQTPIAAPRKPRPRWSIHVIGGFQGMTIAYRF